VKKFTEDIFMKRNKRLLLSLLFGISVSNALSATEDFRQIAEANVARWNEAFSTGKIDEILSLYEDNAMLVKPDGSVSKGSNDIKAFWQALLDKKSGVYAIEITKVKCEKDDMIVTTATLSTSKTLQNPQQVMKYHYDGVLYSVLKRQANGVWKARVQQLY
jgi:uncharacterized protein (TIGR02246 family)